MALPNDVRGWIMTVISGVACVLGAAIICADIVIRRFPGMKDFRIQDSDAFLSASLSLSFGVMLFSALFKMLPSAKSSLQGGGLSPKAAAWVLIVCFLGGVIGIQILSRILHHYIPSHVVDCEHTHDEEDQKEHSHGHARKPSSKRLRFQSKKPSNQHRSPHRPITNGQDSYFSEAPATLDAARGTERAETFMTAKTRPSIKSSLSRTFSKLSSAPADGCKCDSNGPCFGFSEPCGQECFKIVQSRGPYGPIGGQNGRMSRKAKSMGIVPRLVESTPLLTDARGYPSDYRFPETANQDNGNDTPTNDDVRPTSEDSIMTPYDHAVLHRHKSSAISGSSSDSIPSSPQTPHHHHVPTNAFLSIGLQTSIAIALHKLPEGFITFATNHANPKLGFSVFLALFIHNITEGFAMALPLYLALQSRWRAMFWSSLLGGFSQPLGAGVAALWFHLAGNGDMAPGEGVYGGMFAVTSGIMTSVALQLFSESLDLTHNRGLCMVFAFVGMGIMGISSALTA